MRAARAPVRFGSKASVNETALPGWIGPMTPSNTIWNSLTCGPARSGAETVSVSVPTFRRLLDFQRLNLLPVVPSRGSVGASGDLAPLAHLCLPLIGLGEFWDESRARAVPAAAVLREHGLGPLELGAPERRDKPAWRSGGRSRALKG